MGKIKHRLAVISLLAILFTFLTGGETVAYYTTVGTATNVITSGGVTLAIHEMAGENVPFPEEGVTVRPGDVVQKIVTVENVCDHPFYLRVKPVYGGENTNLTPEECMKLNLNREDWTLHSDGWLYYNEVLKPGETTEQVFSQVEIVGSKIRTEHVGSVLTLTVKADAVQSENNEALHPWEAAGWPGEN